MITMADGLLTAAYPIAARLDPYYLSRAQFLGVVDTNALLSSIANDCRKGTYRQSRLLRMTTGGVATLYASNHVYWEVYEHLPRIAKWSKVPVAELRARFEDRYLPFLRFVTVDVSEIDDPQVLAITDVDDVPSGQLAKLLGPCIVFPEDKHLRKPGLAPDNWHEAAQFAVDVIEGV